MGFDIIGVKPTKDVGECFTANIHTWTAVWRFICDNCGDLLTPKQVREGFANNGIAINARQTRSIVERLDGIVTSGKSVNVDGLQLCQ
jgi:hypothetical protein